MRFFNQKAKDLAEGFTHYGSLFGIPCVIGDIESQAPMIKPRYFIPNWVLDIAQVIYFNMEEMLNWDNPEYEPMFKIRLDRPIKPTEGEICQCEDCKNEKAESD